MEEKSRSIDLALHNIYQVIVLFKIELNKIKKIILEHKKKMFSKIWKPNYKLSIERLKKKPSALFLKPVIQSGTMWTSIIIEAPTKTISIWLR